MERKVAYFLKLIPVRKEKKCFTSRHPQQNKYMSCDIAKKAIIKE